MRSGSRAARWMAICPPMECPTRNAGPSAAKLSHSPRKCATPGMSGSCPIPPTRLLPKPMTSGMSTRYFDASAAMLRDHQRDDPDRPCTSATASSPSPASAQWMR